MPTPPPLTAAQLNEARRMRLEGISVREIAARLGRGKTQIAEMLAADPSLPALPERKAPTPEQLEKRAARRVASAVKEADATPALAALAALPRGPAPSPPPGLPEGQAPTEADHDLRSSYLAELLASEHWQGVRTLRDCVERWRIPLREVQAYAEKARKLLRREFGVDNRQRLVTDQLAALRRLADKAENAGAFQAAIAARRVILSTAPPAASNLTPGHRLSAEGLPPELARLKNPPATPQEVAHFAEVDEAACTCTGCRVHPRAEGAQAPAAPGPVVVSAASSQPMH